MADSLKVDRIGQPYVILSTAHIRLDAHQDIILGRAIIVNSQQAHAVNVAQHEAKQG